MIALSLRYRDWVWRGWQTRYTFQRAEVLTPHTVPILLLHGFGASGDHWRNNMPTLAQHHSVYALDLVGFGASEKPPTDYSIYLWVEQVADFWQTFINRPTILVGNSIGSLVAAIAAHTHPEIAKGVVTISLPDIEALQAMVPKPVRPIKSALEAFASAIFAKPMFQIIRQPSVIRFVLGQIAYRDRTHIDDELVEIIAKPARDPQAAEAFVRLGQSLNRPGYSPSLTQALTELEIPILMLWGTQDKAIPPSEGARLVQYSNFAHLVYLDDMGHCAHDEAPERVNQEILTWIAAIGS
ncbi:alpha/beta fold hydrolase [Tumidithrix elongata RA019]|uniref:Alpha/beta fold hydrolase n=1 Tax=Tumidithrix elongata BACA0141 TaxID=2716417 RepID=A0AAW9PV77_9CYAN|nr:alpha/beta fold hydrolase [Tumidithrix elongata RA019]